MSDAIFTTPGRIFDLVARTILEGRCTFRVAIPFITIHRHCGSDMQRLKDQIEDSLIILHECGYGWSEYDNTWDRYKVIDAILDVEASKSDFCQGNLNRLRKSFGRLENPNLRFFSDIFSNRG